MTIEQHPFDLHKRLSPDTLSDLQVDVWQPPTISGSGHLVFAETKPAAMQETPDPVQLSKKEGFDQGFKEGKTEGHAAGKQEGLQAGRQEAIALANKELQPKLAEINKLLTSLTHSLNTEDYKLEKTLFDLVQFIAREVIRKEIELDPAGLMRVIKETIAALPPARDGIKILLNPHDCSLVEEAIAEGGENWRAMADESIARGGCKITTDQSEADASIEQRITAVLEQLYEHQTISPKPGDPGYEEAPEPAVSSPVSSSGSETGDEPVSSTEQNPEVN